MKITLDHNCLIALENNEPNAQYIRELIALHDLKKITLRIVAIGASEMQQSKEYPTLFSDFEKRAAALGLQQVVFPLPVMYWDVTFWDRGVWGGDQTENLERSIHAVLFPEIDFNYEDFCNKQGLDPFNSGTLGETWRNAKCDVLALSSHINDKGAIFVTADRNFHKQTKKPQLLALGVGDILRPEDAVTEIQAALAKL